MVDLIFNKVNTEEYSCGFTMYLPSMEFAKKEGGWVIAHKATTGCFGKEGLRKVVDFAMAHNHLISGYVNKDSIWQFEAVILEPDDHLATMLMAIHNQKRSYHLGTGRVKCIF